MLYLAPMVTGRRSRNDDAQIIITPIPPTSWKSVCRLSVRLHDKPKALAKALRFLREREITILLTEAAATFQERAHWDAICDLTSYKGYANTNASVPTEYFYSPNYVCFLYGSTKIIHQVAHRQAKTLRNVKPVLTAQMNPAKSRLTCRHFQAWRPNMSAI
jgi:hypothetical protein